MSEVLAPYVDKVVSVITNDGSHIIGTLKGFDQAVNVILDECFERVYSTTGVEQVPLGLYVIRGDNLAVIGLLDEEADKKRDLTKIKVQPMKPIHH